MKHNNEINSPPVMLQWMRNVCSVGSVAISSMPATFLAYPVQRLVIHTQLEGVKVSVNSMAQEMFAGASMPKLRYLYKDCFYALGISPLFKAGYATPMLIAKDYIARHDCKHPNMIYYGGALSTVFLQVGVSLDMRMKQLSPPKKLHTQSFAQRWRQNIHRGLLPWTGYMSVANMSSLLFYDKSYDYIREKYPDLNLWWVGAAASVMSLPVAQVLITPVDTWAARKMSTTKMVPIHSAAYRRVYGLRILWKLIENGFLLTSSYAIKDIMMGWLEGEYASRTQDKCCRS